MSRGRTSDGADFDSYLNGHIRSDDDFFTLPEDVQEQVNEHQNEFKSAADMRAYIRDLMRRG